MKAYTSSADRAKSIKTQAVVNENATDRMIRELKEENQRLMEQLKTGGGPTGGTGMASSIGPHNFALETAPRFVELEQLKAALEQNKKEMENMEQTWQQRLAEEAARSKV